MKIIINSKWVSTSDDTLTLTQESDMRWNGYQHNLCKILVPANTWSIKLQTQKCKIPSAEGAVTHRIFLYGQQYQITWNIFISSYSTSCFRPIQPFASTLIHEFVFTPLSGMTFSCQRMLGKQKQDHQPSHSEMLHLVCSFSEQWI